MRIVVAGSSGLVGTALVPALRAAGHEVLRLVRRRPTAGDERQWDPPAGVIEPLDGVHAVVNLCGASVGGKRWSHAYKQELRDSRIEPTEVIAAAIAEHGVPVMINASGAHFYGDTGDTIVDEDSPSGGGFLAALCRDWEAATVPAADAGARVVLLRSGHVLSGAGGLLGRLRPLFRGMLGGTLGGGRQYMPWIHIDDHVAAIRFAIEHEVIAGPVNACAPESVSNVDFTRAFGRALGRPAPWFAPKIALRAILGDFADEVVMSQRMVPKVLRHNDFGYRYGDLDAAMAAAVAR
ncbi:hypothetical protein EV193_10463 [Herbihabitans rhizosphaerae]|uniref:TIGR01777 family protein n=1 Tax=Herbihabitans rhizosphaerae TaxID=1872711 RepID=A0A4Q7KTS5_9PSEU|nr:TIGR01777 family oxidoreductase [Herbihabitans rhizosphaerae]RZS38852.1 hypothetical protein EV193_10463 [Herbihabitans rhizosphaerae]